MIDFNKLSKDISIKRNKIAKNIKEIDKNNHSIDLKSKSIKLESVLNSFPSKGTRSINFHNLLNEKYDFYDTSQFNKISRFVVFVENIEKDYYNLVKKSKKDYISNPN